MLIISKFINVKNLETVWDTYNLFQQKIRILLIVDIVLNFVTIN